jgi:hypothetical protein
MCAIVYFRIGSDGCNGQRRGGPVLVHGDVRSRPYCYLCSVLQDQQQHLELYIAILIAYSTLRALQEDDQCPFLGTDVKLILAGDLNTENCNWNLYRIKESIISAKYKSHHAKLTAWHYRFNYLLYYPFHHKTFQTKSA